MTVEFYSVKDHDYIPREIDRLAGGEGTVVVATLGQHFRHFPMNIFVRRMLNVREAIQRLHLRSPGTKVIIKGENIRETYIDQERVGNGTTPRQKCTIGMSSPTPSGFVWRSWWHPVFCTTSRLNTLDQINACLKKKLISFMGDSTVAPVWDGVLLTRRVSTLKLFDMHVFGKIQNLFAVDMTRNIQIQWKKHGHPFIGSSIYTVKDHSQNFRPFPMELFLRRMLNVRAAIQHLLLRSPDTKVIIKAETVQEINIDLERFGDIHGYTQQLALRDIFRDLRVGFIDAWDMSIACAVNNVHPPEEVLAASTCFSLTHIC
uniref:Uncharacterized protein n=1 Tax=Sphaerodactylus townsendi TaxID=933632 RepID=A0ACB8EYV4_9SAUR